MRALRVGQSACVYIFLPSSPITKRRLGSLFLLLLFGPVHHENSLHTQRTTDRRWPSSGSSALANADRGTGLVIFIDAVSDALFAIG